MTYSLAQPVGYLGSNGASGRAAGPVNGISTLRIDVQRSARNVVSVYGSNVSYDRSLYESVLRRARESDREISQLSGDEAKALVVGVVANVAAGLAQAEQLALQPVSTETERSRNHAAQAELIGAARIMLDAANTALGSARADRGTSGLGNPLVVAGVIAAAAIVYGVVGVAIVMVADAQLRLYQAREEANRICGDGCSPQQRAQLIRQMSLGPLDTIAAGAAEATETGALATGTIAVIAGAGVLAIGGMWFLFGTAAGRRTMRGMRKGATT